MSQVLIKDCIETDILIILPYFLFTIIFLLKKNTNYQSVTKIMLIVNPACCFFKSLNNHDRFCGNDHRFCKIMSPMHYTCHSICDETCLGTFIIAKSGTSFNWTLGTSIIRTAQIIWCVVVY